MTDKVEFYPTVDIKDKDLAMRLEEWQFDYNWHRPHSSLAGKTPLEKSCELSKQTPFWDEVIANYNPLKEGTQERNFLKKLK